MNLAWIYGSALVQAVGGVYQVLPNITYVYLKVAFEGTICSEEPILA